jgi:hypothetical protein
MTTKIFVDTDNGQREVLSLSQLNTIMQNYRRDEVYTLEASPQVVTRLIEDNRSNSLDGTRPYGLDFMLKARVNERFQPDQWRLTQNRVLYAQSGGRSTPSEYADFSVVQDAREKRWKYSEPADVWYFIDDHLGPGSVAPHSARSWQCLLYEFGPLTLSE